MWRSDGGLGPYAREAEYCSSRLLQSNPHMAKKCSVIWQHRGLNVILGRLKAADNL